MSSSIRIRLGGLLVALGLPVLAWAGDPVQVPRKKLIQVGWDMVDTAFLRKHIAEMEAAAPFDGILFWVKGRRMDGGTASPESGWDAAPWDRASFQGAIDDLKACRFTKFTDNFIRFNCTPGTLAWDDDAGWKALADKAAILAWICKEAGVKGICFDPESYGEKQYQYAPAKGRSFPETAALARRRGAQVMRAIAAEHRSLTLMSFWLASLCMAAGQSENSDEVLATHDYGLWPAFLNGLLDEVPPGMTLVDGNENGYYIEGPQYHEVASRMRSLTGPALATVAPEHRAKYRAQTQTGFGFFLDMYINPEGDKYYRGPKPGGTRLDRLGENVAAALEASDQYVWIYGEQCRWWPSFRFPDGTLREFMKGAGKGRMWEEGLPGLGRTLARVKAPVATARAELEALRGAGALVNLARNGDFAKKAGELPAEFATFQETDSKGRFAWDAEGDGSALLRNMQFGCFIQKHPAKPGETFFVEAMARTKGSAVPTLLVRWQRADGAWTRWDLDMTLTFGAPGADGWRRAGGVVRVPEEVGFLVMLPLTRSPSPADSSCWFDNLGLYRMAP
jgi:hypothetical protein